MTRVLHIFGKMNRGGAEMRTVEVMRLLREKQVAFDFCTLSDDTSPGQLDGTIRELGGEVYSCTLRPGMMTFGRRFINFLKKSDYDIVHSHVHYASGYMVYLAKKAGVGSRVVHFRNTADGGGNSIKRRLYRQLMRRMAGKYATGVLAVCKGAMEFGWGNDWRKDPRAEVIYNGLDVSKYKTLPEQKGSVLEEFKVPVGSRIMINVARFSPQKNQGILIEALNEILKLRQDVYLFLVGDGVLRQQMEELATNIGISDRVRFTGVRSDVSRLLKASDVFALPSQWEGLPGVVLEATAAGLPVVATDLPGVREIASVSNNILMFPVGDTKALAESLLETLNRNSNTAVEFPGLFSLESCASNLYEFYHKQVKEGICE